jgi:hypothetical protein
VLQEGATGTGEEREEEGCSINFQEDFLFPNLASFWPPENVTPKLEHYVYEKRQLHLRHFAMSTHWDSLYQ